MYLQEKTNETNTYDKKIYDTSREFIFAKMTIDLIDKLIAVGGKHQLLYTMDSIDDKHKKMLIEAKYEVHDNLSKDELDFHIINKKLASITLNSFYGAAK